MLTSLVTGCASSPEEVVDDCVGVVGSREKLKCYNLEIRSKIQENVKYLYRDNYIINKETQSNYALNHGAATKPVLLVDGDITVQFSIDEHGVVSDIEITDSSGDGTFDDEFKRAIEGSSPFIVPKDTKDKRLINYKFGL